MSGRCIDREEICLDQRGEHRLGGATSDNKIELFDQSNTNRPLLVMTTMIAIRGDIDRSLHEVIPAEDLLGPKLESEQEVEVRSVGQGHLTLTETDKALHHLIIVID